MYGVKLIPGGIFIYPLDDCFLWKQKPFADLDSGQGVEPDKIFDNIVEILGLADFWDTKELNQFLFCHQIRHWSSIRKIGHRLEAI